VADPLEHPLHLALAAFGDDELEPVRAQGPNRCRCRWAVLEDDAYYDPNMMPDLAALQRNVDMTKQLGFAQASFDVKAYSDLSMVEEANKRLK